jgi:glucuronate isomerase
VMLLLARMNAEKKWVQQIHIGALRNVNTRFRKRLGVNTGFDTIGDAPIAASLARFLDRLDADGKLAKTILFCLNPSDNAVLAAVSGCYPEEGVRGKIQFGPAWWFNDQKRGMEEQMKILAEMGLLSRFVGMVTDSRSFLSYPRHEYFRRILCDVLGGAMERGEIPRDFDLVGGIVEEICYENAREFFALPVGASPPA